MRRVCPVFNTNRMVQEYALEGYRPALERRARLEADGFKGARELARWRHAVRDGWREVRIERVLTSAASEVQAGDEIEVSAWIRLGSLAPEDVEAQVYGGRLTETMDIAPGEIVAMGPEGASGGVMRFHARVTCRQSGRYGFTVRVLPRHADLNNAHELGLIAWASETVQGDDHEHGGIHGTADNEAHFAAQRG